MLPVDAKIYSDLAESDYPLCAFTLSPLLDAHYHFVAATIKHDASLVNKNCDIMNHA